MKPHCQKIDMQATAAFSGRMAQAHLSPRQRETKRGDRWRSGRLGCKQSRPSIRSSAFQAPPQKELQSDCRLDIISPALYFYQSTMLTNTSKVTARGQPQSPFYPLFFMGEVCPIKSGIIACVFSVVNI